MADQAVCHPSCCQARTHLAIQLLKETLKAGRLPQAWSSPRGWRESVHPGTLVSCGTGSPQDSGSRSHRTAPLIETC